MHESRWLRVVGGEAEPDGGAEEEHDDVEEELAETVAPERERAQLLRPPAAQLRRPRHEAKVVCSSHLLSVEAQHIVFKKYQRYSLLDESTAVVKQVKMSNTAPSHISSNICQTRFQIQ